MNESILTMIPHRDEMLLIDEIIDKTYENFTSQVAITENSLFAKEKGVPSYCGFEYMAQTIAAFNSAYFKNRNNSKIGFIVSIRNFKSSVNYFLFGDRLYIKVKPKLIVDSSGSFDCEIYIDKKVVAHSRITAYMPTEDELCELRNE